MSNTSQPQDKQETRQDALYGFNLPDHPETQTQQIVEENPEVSAGLGEAKGETVSTAASPDLHVSAYDPYKVPEKTVELFGQEFTVRAPYALEAKTAAHLVLKFWEKAEEGQSEIYKEVAARALQGGDKSIENLSPEELEAMAQELAEQAMGDQSLDLVLEGVEWVNLCEHVLNLYFSPSIEYKKLAVTARDEQGNVRYPIEEAHQAVMEWIAWSEVLTYLRGIAK